MRLGRQSGTGSPKWDCVASQSGTGSPEWDRVARVGEWEDRVQMDDAKTRSVKWQILKSPEAV